jgi:hypothetical protein
MKLLGSRGLLGLFASLALMSINAARGDIIFVTNNGTGTVGEYTTSGATVNASLISGLSALRASRFLDQICLSRTISAALSVNTPLRAQR